MPTASLFPNFECKRIQTSETEINLVVGGEGPPLLLLHGYPQSHIIWHKVAPKLAEFFTVVATDLRGYGDSGKPKTDEQHLPYSKRVMAKDQVEVMQYLGFDTFKVIGHDRGARVAHRMALDHPKKVEQLVLLDILPTLWLYDNTDQDFATNYWHWFFLIQPYPLPETLIGQSADFMAKAIFGPLLMSGACKPTAFAAYQRTVKEADILHATCEDYRAGATVDLVHDRADFDERIQCPVQVLWGLKNPAYQQRDVLKVWREKAVNVVGNGLDSGHFIAEEAPEAMLTEVIPFLRNG
ncbi:MAG: alpha/beta hydrolase [Bacteroidota bacterium]